MSIAHSQLLSVLNYDPLTGHFTWIEANKRRGAGERAGNVMASGYRRIRIDGRHYYEHRLAVFYMTGAWPVNMVDHENLAKDDNRWKNLRPSTRAQNGANRRVHRSNRVGFKGVVMRDGKFAAQIAGEALGRFSTAEEAHGAYCAAALKRYGDFARAA